MKKLIFIFAIIAIFAGNSFSQPAVGTGFAQRGGGGTITGITFDGNGIVIGSPADSLIIEIPVSIEATLSVIISAGAQFRISYDAANYLQIDVLDDGHTTFTTVDPDGAEADINFTPDGNVGIKTAAPSTALEVTGTITATEFVGGGSGLTGLGGWTDDGTVVRLETLTDNVGIGTVTPASKLEIANGNVDIHDIADLASESFDDETDFSQATWTLGGEVAVDGTDATYTFAGSGAGTILQTSGNMVISGIANRWYVFDYTVASSTVAGETVTISGSTFASTIITLDVSSNGAQTVTFFSATVPGNFTITVAGATSGAFTITEVSLKQVTGGDLAVHGLITGGGSEGIKIASNGFVGISLGANLPSRTLTIGNTTSGGANNNFVNSTTGYTSSDGFNIGLDAAEAGTVWHFENQPINFGTNNDEVVRFHASGGVSIGDDVVATDPGVDNLLVEGGIQSNSTVTMVGLNQPGVTVTNTSSYAVLAANTGKRHIIGDLGQVCTITLPVEAAGLNYEFWYYGANPETHDHIILTNGGNSKNFKGGVVFLDVGNSISEVSGNGSTNSKLTINNMSGGSFIKMFCDGTNWFVTGTVVSDVAPAWADQ